MTGRPFFEGDGEGGGAGEEDAMIVLSSLHVESVLSIDRGQHTMSHTSISTVVWYSRLRCLAADLAALSECRQNSSVPPREKASLRSCFTSARSSPCWCCCDLECRNAASSTSFRVVFLGVGVCTESAGCCFRRLRGVLEGERLAAAGEEGVGGRSRKPGVDLGEAFGEDVGD